MSNSSRPAEKGAGLEFIGENVRRWRHLADMSSDKLANAAGLSNVRMLESGASGTSIGALRDIAHALGLKLQHLTREPSEFPKALLDFLESPMAVGVTDEETAILREIEIPRRRLTPEAYYLALQMIRRSELVEGGT